MLKLCAQAFYVHKDGNEPEEYEDAFGYNRNCMAVADGATDSVGSGLWARLLVQAFISKRPIPNTEAMIQWLEDLAQVWNQKIPWDRVPWYAVKKAKRGPISTFLGVSFDWSKSDLETNGVAAFEAVAVGDSCLFQVRHNELIRRSIRTTPSTSPSNSSDCAICFPPMRSADFGTRSPLLSIWAEDNRRVLSSNLRQCQGQCELGDLFILATDAFSGWFVRQIEGNERPWQYLAGLTEPKFLEMVEQLRREKSMKNDDVTVLLGQVEQNDYEKVSQT